MFYCLQLRVTIPGRDSTNWCVSAVPVRRVEDEDALPVAAADRAISRRTDL